MGAGLRKWRGSQISVGQGRGGRDGRAASLGRASLPTLDAAVLASPPQKKTFLGAKFPAPATPASWTRRAWGIPSRCPEAGGAGGSLGRCRPCCGHAVGSAAGAVPTLARCKSASRLQRTSLHGARQAAKTLGMPGLPLHPPRRWPQALRGHRSCPESHFGPGSAVCRATLWLTTQTPAEGTPGGYLVLPASTAFLCVEGVSKPGLRS